MSYCGLFVRHKNVSGEEISGKTAKQAGPAGCFQVSAVVCDISIVRLRLRWGAGGCEVSLVTDLTRIVVPVTVLQLGDAGLHF